MKITNCNYSIKKQSSEVLNKMGDLKNFTKLTENFFLRVLRKFLEHFFDRTTLGDYFCLFDDSKSVFRTLSGIYVEVLLPK